CGVGPGDEVIVQSFTFCASSHPVTYLGATPVFVDSERETWNIDPELLEYAIKDRITKTGKKPKAIIPVALYGMPYRIDEIMAIADRYEIPVIEDAAEGFGSRYNGQMLGTFGRYGALSFNGNKMITTSGGGALICGPTPTLPSREGKSPYMTADPILYDRLKEYARDMRKNPTEAERVAWSVLCDEQTGYKFRRQHIIGDYIVDFVCLEKMLIVEIDGEYHNDWEQQVDDASRTEWLAIKGFRVIRYTNTQVIASPDMFEREVKAALALQNPLPLGDGWGGADTIMWYATQARESYPYYQHEKIGYNYRMSNICAGIGRGQMTVANKHIEHHKHVQALYEELLADVPGISVHCQPQQTCPLKNANGEQDVYDSNYWLCTITLAPELRIKGQENAYKSVIKSAVGGAAGVIHEAETATTDCQPNDNVEALRVYLDQAGIEARPVWKPMHCQPVYRQGVVKMENIRTKDEDIVCQTSDSSVAYINGISEDIFKIGMCLPAGPYVSDDDVRYIVEKIRAAID
ncbi:MAG: DegT/DnrJ/EryC1/StrS family aminotransferase, partial [Bacteroidaceae bacterium]|nr:DegT/DnrJ/EryC1/StrS family aminotransferase [Bacteroidaceae bacterium]